MPDDHDDAGDVKRRVVETDLNLISSLDGDENGDRENETETEILSIRRDRRNPSSTQKAK